jgi:CSLREA domain-containing protein
MPFREELKMSRRWHASAWLSVPLVIGLALGVGVTTAGAATITVNTTADTAANDGTCTFREAIDAAGNDAASGGAVGECAAGQPGPTRDVIVFSIGAAGSAQTITLSATGNLPPVNASPLEIDGRNGAAPSVVFPRIGIDASTATGAGLVVSQGADGSFIHHLAIYDAGDDGIRVQNDDNVLSNLVVGLDQAGTNHPNGSNGIEVRGADNTISASVISANAANGIDIADDSLFSATTGTTISGNWIGLGLDGTSDHGNALDGIAVGALSGAVVASTTIGGGTGLAPGGACSGDCNAISGNNSDGIDLNMAAATSALTSLVIRGNFIGTDAPGTGAIPNSTGGIRMRGHLDGASLRENLVSGNTGDGILLLPGTVGGPSHSVIAANRIGVDTQADGVLPNTGRGINVAATVAANDGPMTGNVIGGTTDPTPGGVCDGDCNVIGGNGVNGIDLFGIDTAGPIRDTKVLGNYIGADLAGTGDVGNTQSGIFLGGVGGTVIGTSAAPNVISGNNIDGVQIAENAPGGNLIQGNRIGTTANGTGALGNSDNGVSASVSGDGAIVGGTSAGAANTIANNGDAGVKVQGFGPPFPSFPILGNSIHDNSDLGIDLMPDGITPGVTANDGAGDPDAGGNGLQNFPVLDTVAAVGSETFVLGRLDSAGSTSYRIELFANASADPSGNGEGAELAGAFSVTTDSSGHAEFVRSVSGTVAAGKSTTATATRLDGAGNPIETSEFAANLSEGCDVTGTSGPETLTGTAASDVICGLGGNDVIDGLGGDDVIIGGDGSDTASYGGAAAAVTVDLPAGTAVGGAGSDLLRDVEGAAGSSFGDHLTALTTGSALDGMGGSDTLTGAAAPDSLTGGDGNDTLNGAGGSDQIAGGGGADTASGGDGSDIVAGGGGNDSLDGGNGTDTVNGDDDDDALTGGTTADQVNGGGGNDALAGGDGDDVLAGGAGLNSFDGGAGTDFLVGGASADSGTGGDGDDVIAGDDGDDVLSGGTGNDALDGGIGNDTLAGEDGDDTVNGVDGNDLLTGGIGSDTIDAGAGDDTASGDDDDDSVLGQSGDDTLTGGAGSDTVKSHGGRDDVKGNGGEDVVTSGGGDKDEARGGGGDDTVKGGGGKKDDVRGGGGKDHLDGGGGKKDDCDGGGGKDDKRSPGCEKEKSIP